MTKVEIIALQPRNNPRIFRADDTGELLIILEGLPGELATVIPTPENIVGPEVVEGLMSASLLRSTAEGRPDAALAASSDLTFTSKPADGEAISIGSTSYILKVTPSSAFQVAIAGSLAGTISNLVEAINNGPPISGGAHPDVTAAGSATVLSVTATTAGEPGNEIPTSTTTSASWDGATLTGGIPKLTPTRVGQVCRYGDSSPYSIYVASTLDPDTGWQLVSSEGNSVFWNPFAGAYRVLTLDADDNFDFTPLP